MTPHLNTCLYHWVKYCYEVKIYDCHHKALLQRCACKVSNDCSIKHTQQHQERAYSLDTGVCRAGPLNLQRGNTVLIEEHQLNWQVPSLGKGVACRRRTTRGKPLLSTGTNH